MRSASASSSATKWTLPLTEACICAPPTSSGVHCCPVTARMTSGPVMNICACFFVMTMKSISAGE